MEMINVRGMDTWLFGSPELRRVTREHFKCPTAMGTQMENGGGAGT